jgi:hypothetical protein
MFGKDRVGKIMGKALCFFTSMTSLSPGYLKSFEGLYVMRDIESAASTPKYICVEELCKM